MQGVHGVPRVLETTRKCIGRAKNTNNKTARAIESFFIRHLRVLRIPHRKVRDDERDFRGASQDQTTTGKYPEKQGSIIHTSQE